MAPKSGGGRCGFLMGNGVGWFGVGNTFQGWRARKYRWLMGMEIWVMKIFN